MKVALLKQGFDQLGRDETWDPILQSGNPIKSGDIKTYLKQTATEQSKAYVAPKQAIPSFLGEAQPQGHVHRQAIGTVTPYNGVPF